MVTMTRTPRRRATITAAVLLTAHVCSAQISTDLSIVPLLDGEVEDQSGRTMNRFGGNPVGGGKATLVSAASAARTGSWGLQLLTNEPIPAGGFDFAGTALAGFFTPSPPPPPPSDPCDVTGRYIDTRDLSRFSEVRFWLRNHTGSEFTLAFEIKDYRDCNSQLARRTYLIGAAADWVQISAPIDLASGWAVAGSPDLTRAKLFTFVIDANRGQSVNGAIDLDDMILVERGGPLAIQSAPVNSLIERLAQRQFVGLWGARDRATGMVPSLSSWADVCAINVLAALVQSLPGAIDRNWVSASAADQYVTQVVASLNTIMNSALYVPPRYVDRVSLAPAHVREESSVDAAFLFLALYTYQVRPATAIALRTSIIALLGRFNFAGFSSPGGWRLAYKYPNGIDPGGLTAGTYDGYSSEPWLISLAAHLSPDDAHRVAIGAHYHSAVNRVLASQGANGRTHLVHTLADFRAPFLQWLMTLFVKTDERGRDTYPDAALSGNPHVNAVKYQLDAHARAAQLGRSTRLQPDAGDDGTGMVYEQFSYYKDFGQPGVFMPWAAAWSFLADLPFATAALREILSNGFHGPLGLTDSVNWPTGAAQPSRVTARHDFWNVALSTLALVQYRYGGNALLLLAPEVVEALDEVFLPRAFTDDITAGLTPIRAVHIQEIRDRIDVQRARLGLGAVAWTGALAPQQTAILAVHISEARAALDSLHDAIPLTRPTYTDPLLGVDVPIRRVHIIQLRQALLTIESQ